MFDTSPEFQYMQGMVKEFNETYEVEPDLKRQFDLVDEEAGEFMEASIELAMDPTPETAAHFLKEVVDFYYVMCGVAVILEPYDADTRQEMTGDAVSLETMSKMVLATEGIRAASGVGFIKPQMIREAFVEVHRSNMSKLAEDGSVIRREDGKVLKGPNYFEPDLSSYGIEIARIYKENF